MYRFRAILGQNTVFSDEKRFNLDGPDGMAYYWHDKRLDPRYFSRRQHGGGGFMIGVPFLIVAFRIWTSQLSLWTLKSTFRCWTRRCFRFSKNSNPNKVFFQHDNATCHASIETKTWLFDMEIDTISWPACSPDLNPIEILWGHLVRLIYKNFKQYNSVEDLRDAAVIDAWAKIPVSYLKNLIISMPDRCAAVLETGGRRTKY